MNRGFTSIFDGKSRKNTRGLGRVEVRIGTWIFTHTLIVYKRNHKKGVRYELLTITTVFYCQTSR